MASAYTTEQIQQWEEYVELPARFRVASKPSLDPDYLTALHVRQISRIPYENLTLHYSVNHTVSLNPHDVFKKTVLDNRGRGGYCMELSIMFNHILRAVGFTVYTAGVRIRPRVGGIPSGDYIGWKHIVNIVTLENGDKWVLDVGFGGDGMTKPLPMIPGHVVHNLGTQEIRLVYDTIPTQVDKTKPLWIYQYRNSPTADWNSFYCFGEFEFTPKDFEVVNYWTSTNLGPDNFQTTTVLVIRFLKSSEEERIVGKIMLVNNQVKRNDGGKTVLIKTLKSDDERREVLKELFGIYLTDEEFGAIKGRNVELICAL